MPRRTRHGQRARRMAWIRLRAIVGSLGIYTKIDFGRGRVVDCHSTSSIFRGYSIFMKGKDPRDAHYITSRICGICGDNHCEVSTWTQNMAFGVVPRTWAMDSRTSARLPSTCSTTHLPGERSVGVDFCEKMVAETNPGVLDLANRTPAPNRPPLATPTVPSDIVAPLNPFLGRAYREALGGMQPLDTSGMFSALWKAATSTPPPCSRW